MSKVFFFKKESKGMHKIIQLISNFLYNKTFPILWKYMFIGWIGWKTKSNKNFKILKERATRQMTHLKNHLIKKLRSMGSKCLALNASHMSRK
jgi:hypothetical protein